VKRNKLLEYFVILSFFLNLYSLSDSCGSGSEEFFNAVADGNLNLVKSFVKKEGVNVVFDCFGHYCTQAEQMPIHVAAWEGHEEIVKFLLDAGADINSRSAKYKSTPLLCWLRNGLKPEDDKFRVTTYLVERGANIHLKDKFLRSPLYWGVDLKSFNLVVYFIELGAKTDSLTLLLSHKDRKISSYLEYVTEFDNMLDKVKFITEKILDTKVPRAMVQALILMALRRTLNSLSNLRKEQYCTLCNNLWKKIKSNKKIKDTVFRSHEASKMLIAHKHSEQFKENLYKLTKNNSCVKRDVLVRCVL